MFIASVKSQLAWYNFRSPGDQTDNYSNFHWRSLIMYLGQHTFWWATESAWKKLFSNFPRGLHFLQPLFRICRYVWAALAWFPIRCCIVLSCQLPTAVIWYLNYCLVNTFVFKLNFGRRIAIVSFCYPSLFELTCYPADNQLSIFCQPRKKALSGSFLVRLFSRQSHHWPYSFLFD